MSQPQKEFEILKNFTTSFGLILTIKFFSIRKPGLGQKIIFREKEYQVAGIFLHSYPYIANVKLHNRMHNGIFDCIVKPA
jgi:hypothetical protein